MNEPTTKREMECAMRRSLWTCPHRTVWRAALWFYWKRVPPWRLNVWMLGFINPVPLRGAALRGLMAQIPEPEEDA